MCFTDKIILQQCSDVTDNGQNLISIPCISVTTTSYTPSMGTSVTTTYISPYFSPSPSTMSTRSQTYTTGRLPATSIPETMAIPPSNSGVLIIIILSIIMLIMAIFICIILSTLIVKRVRKKRCQGTLSHLVRENVYQTIDANRRPSCSIPIATHNGECLKMSEFPRYDLENQQKLPDVSNSQDFQKCDFAMDQAGKATQSPANGCPPTSDNIYSSIPVNNIHYGSYIRNEGYTHTLEGCPQQEVPRLSTCSSTYEVINPYSTLDEARRQALAQIRSTHNNDASDDILELNLVGSDKPNWTNDTRPLQLNIPTTLNMRARKKSCGLGDDEDQYIVMAGDLEGGWGELASRGHGLDTIDGRCDIIMGLGAHEPDIEHYETVPPRRENLAPNAWEDSDNSDEESPPATDKSIEDLYAKVRKKSERIALESSDNDLANVSDDDAEKLSDDSAINVNVERLDAVYKGNASPQEEDMTENEVFSVFGENQVHRCTNSHML